MASSWFDDSYYLSAKAAYNNAHAINGLTTWTVTSVQASLNAAGMTAEQHYSQYGWTEGLAPNAYYVESQYVTSKVAALNAGAVGGKTDWTADDFYASLNGANPFMHYVQYGAYETGVEPSTGFSDDTYYADKAIYNNANAVGGITTWTADTVKAAFQANGLTPIGHYELYGATEAFYTPTPTPVPGQTYTLTAAIDTITGTAGNDTILGDVTTTQVADTINGNGGIDTLKEYLGAATAIDTMVLPQLTAVENIYVNSGVFTNTKSLDVSGLADVTNIAFDSVKTFTGGDAFTITTSATQSLGLTNINTAAAGTATLNLKGSSAVTLNAVGTNTTNTGTVKLDLTGTQSTLGLTTTGAASKLTLADTGAKLTTLNLAGDQALTLTEAINGLKTINAGSATGNMTVDASGATLDSTFAFTGGSGNDSLALKAGALGLLTAGSQLDGGTGTDTLVTNEAAALTAAQVSKVNATKNFEVLGFGTSASGVDISTLTGINNFSVLSTATGTTTFTKANSSSAFTVDISANTTAVSVTNAVGETATNVAITNTSGAAKTLTTLTLNGATTVALSSTGNTGASNTITTLANQDNSAITLTGSANLTTAISGTATGSKFDASSFTGNLTLTGSTFADVLLGGSGTDILTSGGGADTFTGGAGTNKFSAAEGDFTASTTVYDTITDWTAGTNSIDDSTTAISLMPTGTAGALTINSEGLVTGGATTLSQFVTEASLEATTAGSSCVWSDGTNSYVFVSDGGATTNDLLFKISGVNATTGLIITGGDITSIA